MDKGRAVDIVHTDFSEIFSSHKIFVDKLLKYGMNNQLREHWLKSGDQWYEV